MSSFDDEEDLLPRVSVRLASVTRTRMSFVAKHNLRQGRIPKYVDASRSHLNVVLAGPPVGTFKGAAEECAERYRRRTGQKVQQRQALLVEGIITFSRVAQPLVAADLDQAHACALRLVQDLVHTYGHGASLVSLVFHADESAPHYHFVMGGVGMDGRAVLQRMPRKEMVHVQDLAGEAFASMGIRRGVPVIERMQRGDDRSKIVHRSVRQLHADLPKEIARVQRKLATETVQLAELQAKASTTQRRLEKARIDLEKMQAQTNVDEAKALKLRERVKDYTARLAKQQEQIAAVAPKPTPVTIVTGMERGLLGSRPTTARQEVYAAPDVARFEQQVSHALVQQKDRARKAEQERDAARQEVGRLRSIMSEYPELLGWRLQARRAGVTGLEQACLIHFDHRYVYALNPKTHVLVEAPRPRNLRLEHGMVLEFDGNAVRSPDQATIRALSTAEVIAAIEGRVVAKMHSALQELKVRLEQEQAELAALPELQEESSDLDLTQMEGTMPQQTPSDHPRQFGDWSRPV